jgi:glutaminyl-tRNA synthetase
VHARVQGQPRHLRLAGARGRALDGLSFALASPPPTQIEFAPLELDYTVLSKRKFRRLVDEGHVAGWDDPRMPTIAGLRRRGVTPEALRAFADAIGVARKPARTELATFEHFVRDDLNMRVPRRMCVVHPVKLVVTNYPEGQVEELDAPSYPHDVPLTGQPPVPFSRELWIERDDFLEDAPKKYFRLTPGARGAAALRVPRHLHGRREGRGGRGRRGALHLRPGHARRRRARRAARAGHHPLGERRGAADCEVRLYDRLFTEPDPDDLPGRRLHDGAQPRVARRSCAARRWSRACSPTRRGRATSSSAPATS